MCQKKDDESLIVYLEQIPEEYTFSDYPTNTLFVIDDTPPYRIDPVTLRPIRREPRPKVYPPNAKKKTKKE
jgi:hypothetical protein